MLLKCIVLLESVICTFLAKLNKHSASIFSCWTKYTLFQENPSGKFSDVKNIFLREYTNYKPCLCNLLNLSTIFCVEWVFKQIYSVYTLYTLFRLYLQRAHLLHWIDLKTEKVQNLGGRDHLGKMKNRWKRKFLRLQCQPSQVQTFRLKGCWLPPLAFESHYKLCHVKLQPQLQ